MIIPKGYIKIEDLFTTLVRDLLERECVFENPYTKRNCKGTIKKISARWCYVRRENGVLSMVTWNLIALKIGGQE